jgi:ATP-dependent RNA helicase DDX54/DBP10
MGFEAQLREILSKMPEHRQTLLVSATLPRSLVAFAKAGLREPELVRIDADAKLSDALRLAFFTVRREEKVAALLWILRQLLPEKEQVLVFVATRHHVEFIARILNVVGSLGGGGAASRGADGAPVAECI